jgi:tetratricopeptide (TPR) repeat protein
MGVEGPKSKIITVSLLLKDVQNDSHFFNVPGEISESSVIKDVVLKKYRTNVGILEGFVDGNRLILQWYPERVEQSAEALHIDASELARLGRYEDAIVKWEKAISLNEEDVDYVYKLGLVYFEMKKYHDSIRYLERAVKICPIHFRVHLLIGIDWIKLRKFEKAETHVLESNRLNRSNILTYLNLGAIYSVQKRFNEAIDMFNTTIQLSPTESRAYLGLARIYNMLDDVEASNSYFKKVIELSPGTKLAEYAKRSIRIPENHVAAVGTKNNREERFAKGIGFYLTGDYRLASNQYKEYLKNQPSDDYAWYLLGEVKLRLGELEEATDCFKRAIRLNQKKGLYYKLLGISLHYQGKSKEVVEVLKKAIDMGKKDALSWTIQGINLMRQKKFEEAINNFKLALKKNSNNPLCMYNLAVAFVKMNENDRAVELAKKIITFEYYAPIKVQAKKLLQNLNPSQ